VRSHDDEDEAVADDRRSEVELTAAANLPRRPRSDVVVADTDYPARNVMWSSDILPCGKFAGMVARTCLSKN
jgi:hypothetical protein